jgi:hypothetical protein
MEFAVEAARRGARVLTGRSYESEQILPLGPWADAFRKAGILHGEEIGALPAAARAELTRLFPEVGGGDAEGATPPITYIRLQDPRRFDGATHA